MRVQRILIGTECSQLEPALHFLTLWSGLHCDIESGDLRWQHTAVHGSFAKVEVEAPQIREGSIRSSIAVNRLQRALNKRVVQLGLRGNRRLRKDFRIARDDTRIPICHLERREISFRIAPLPNKSLKD